MQYPYSASIVRIKKTAKIVAKELKIPLFEAQDIVAGREHPDKTFAEITLRANAEKQRDLEDRKQLAREVVTYLESEHSQVYLGDEWIDLSYKEGSPFEGVDNSDCSIICAYKSNGQRAFSVLFPPSKPSDDWNPEVPDSLIKAIRSYESTTFDWHPNHCIIPAYRFKLYGIPLWRHIVKAAFANLQSRFNEQLLSDLYGPMYAYGLIKPFDKPDEWPLTFTLDGLYRDNKFIGTIPTVSTRRSSGEGRFTEAFTWLQDAEGKIYSSFSRMFDDFGLQFEVLNAIAFIRLKDEIDARRAISHELLERREKEFHRIEDQTPKHLIDVIQSSYQR